MIPPEHIRLQRDVTLAPFTTLRVGGPAKIAAWPSSVSDVVACVKYAHFLGLPVVPIGGGSNLLVSDRGFEGMAIMMKSLDGITIAEDLVTVGAGLRIQKLIAVAKRSGLGGLEYLVSVPGMIGGMIATNAGRGANHKQEIGDSVVSVTVIDTLTCELRVIDDCEFSYRDSVFLRNPSLIILEAIIQMKKMNSSLVERRLGERMDFVRRTQDRSLPNAGTVFKHGFCCSCKGLALGNVRFSLKTDNWIVVEEEGREKEISLLIEMVSEEHVRRGFLAPVLEWQRLGSFH